MAFCPKCGKQLEDGQVCTCQVQPVQPQPVQVQPVQPKAAASTPKFFKVMLNFFKGVFTKPADSVREYVAEAPILTPVILVGALSLISAIIEVIRMVIANAKALSSLGSLASFYSYKPTYSVLNIVGGFFGEIIYMFAATALSAVLIMALVNALDKKAEKVTYTKAFAIASLVFIASVPFNFVGSLFGFIPLTFFSYVKSWFVSVGTAISVVFVLTGIKSVTEDDNNMPLVYATIALATTVLSTLLGAIGL